jgi:hypothetical protein
MWSIGFRAIQHAIATAIQLTCGLLESRILISLGAKYHSTRYLSTTNFIAKRAKQRKKLSGGSRVFGASGGATTES